ncbi:MAG TPA: response regulator [Candidatus Omnitrophota bacterium]|nr:response regulator [Candidatus Omnitrophota bacterium]
MPKILIISSDINLTTMLEARLLLDGYEVFTAEDGLLGFQKIHELQPQLIILDAVLSKMPGYQLFEKVKALPDFRRTPVIVIADPGLARDLFRAEDVFYFCSKPILCAEFMKKVSLAVKPAETEKTAESKEGGLKSPSGKRRVLLGGPSEFILKKMQSFLASEGFTVEIEWDEKDVIQTAKKIRPHYIFVQFWQDMNIFNARKIQKELAEDPHLQTTPFYVFSDEKLAGFTCDFMPRDRVISFHESPDLLAALTRILSIGKGS